MTDRMTPAEAVMLCRYTKACCPQQQFDEYTPDVWHDLLGDYSFADCKAAVGAVAQRQAFVAPAEIRAEVRRIRYKRIEEFGYITPPYGLTFEQEQAYTKAIRDRVGAGDLTREQYDAELRAKGITGSRGMPTRRELEAVFQAHPSRLRQGRDRTHARTCRGDRMSESPCWDPYARGRSIDTGQRPRGDTRWRGRSSPTPAAPQYAQLPDGEIVWWRA
jgi:hypothetical protein